METTKPEVGMGATVCHWTDRTACTVVEVSPTGSWVRLRADHARHCRGSSIYDQQRYLYAADPNGLEYVATRRRDGTYRLKGHSAKQCGRVLLGVRDRYYDPHF